MLRNDLYTVLTLEHQCASTKNYHSVCFTCCKLSLLPSSFLALQLQEEVVGHMQETLQESRFNTLALATRLAAAGYAVIMRTAKGGGPTFSCFRNLRHEFLTVRGRDDCKGMDFIIEPSFRCHFEIAHPAPEYKVLLDAVPSVFVGRPSQLTRLVESLCAEIAISFQNQGMALPPWRRTDSVLSKWLSTNVNDVTVLANLPEACDVTRAARLVLV